MMDPAIPLDDPAGSGIVVMLATFNGAETLPEVLEGYAALARPAAAWSIIVVDNGSTDDTPAILERYRERLPLHILHMPSPGKNKALNHGISMAGDGAGIYIFTDDDAVPGSSFLVDWEEGFRRYPESNLFGATVRPRFRQSAPLWLAKFTRHFGELYARNEGGDRPIRATDIFGPNMAVRGAIIRRGLRFNEDIGPNSSESAYPMGSETEFCERVAAQDSGQPRFLGAPAVEHIVRPRQTTPDFIRQRAFRHGRGTAMRQSITDPGLAMRPRTVKSRVKGAWWQMLSAFGAGRGWWEANWQRGYWHFMDERREASRP